MQQAREGPKPANAPSGFGPVSRCRPHGSIIEAKLDPGLSAQRIYRDLVAEQGFSGSYYSVRRFVRKLGASRELPFRRIESSPGQEATLQHNHCNQDG